MKMYLACVLTRKEFLVRIFPDEHIVERYFHAMQFGDLKIARLVS